MQNAAFQAAGIAAVYVALDVPPERLGESLRGLHAADVAGLNLTSPHKEAVWPHLSGATVEAERIRAANTLRREEKGWVGHATDGPGFRDWMKELGIDAAGAGVLLLGAGGAARSILPVLESLRPRSIAIVSRRAERAEELASGARRSLGKGTPVESAALEGSSAGGASPPWDLLIRALASDTIDRAERRWWNQLAQRATVIELNYGARAAASERLAASKGIRFEDGLGLLLHQGAHSFAFWTGATAPLDAMRKALLATAG
jgi:shikimate dehydrogenase